MAVRKTAVQPAAVNKPSPILSYGIGFALVLVITFVARYIAGLKVQVLNIMGPMIVAILLGIAWRATVGVPKVAQTGVNFTAKRILRVGVILMGIRLNINQIVAAGPKVLGIDVLVMTFTLTLFWLLGKQVKLPSRLTALVGFGTAVCGAAAIAALAPLIHSDDSETALSVGLIGLLGTVGALSYTFLQPILHLSNYAYGVLVGSTLHEVAHVVAAGMAGGTTGGEIAILVKLGRVALLIPAALIVSYLFNRENATTGKTNAKLQFPWFVVGFLVVSIINSINILTKSQAALVLQTSIFLLTMAMGAMGLNFDLKAFQKVGGKALVLGITGSLCLALFGRLLLVLFHIV